jgi:hypothetical protein
MFLHNFSYSAHKNSLNPKLLSDTFPQKHGFFNASIQVPVVAINGKDFAHYSVVICPLFL